METKKDSRSAGLSDFYFEQMEQLEPKIKQGIEDWFTFYGKLWNQGLTWQEDLIKQFTNSKESSTEFTRQSRSLIQKVMNIQKDFSNNVVDAAMRGVQSLKKSQEKNTTTK